jgi:hypothetical protein
MIVLFYLCRENKKRLAISYGIYCTAYFLIFVPQLPRHAINFIANTGAPQILVDCIRAVCELVGFETVFSAGDFVHSLLYVNFQWMMIFALPFMLAYNGQKGKGLKRLFYTYYPVHLIILHIIGTIASL